MTDELMQLLVVGAAGLLGSNVVATGLGGGYDVAGTYHSTEPSFEAPLHDLDIRDRERFGEILDETAPEAVINCAAMTDVDGCESATDVAYEVNGAAPGRLAAECEVRDVRFVHVSTDYVFDGQAVEPYLEEDDANPIQEYGETKLDGERAVHSSHSNPLIARLSFVYGTHGATGELTGFPAWVRGRLEESEETPLFVDQHVTPSRAGSTAEMLLDAVEQGLTRTYHVVCRDCVTPYEFGRRVCEHMNAEEGLLAEGSQTTLDRPAERPTYTCLDVGKLEEALGRKQPTLDEDLSAIADAF